jgi:hypothetical protein
MSHFLTVMSSFSGGKIPLYCVPLAACPPVQLEHTGSKLPVAHENPDFGEFSPSYHKF